MAVFVATSSEVRLGSTNHVRGLSLDPLLMSFLDVAQKGAGAFHGHARTTEPVRRWLTLTSAHALLGIAEVNVKQV